MSNLSRGDERVQQLCDLLKKETLDPAQDEAKKILDNAEARAEKILQNARTEGDQILEDAKKKVEEERRVFDSSLSLAAKQTLLALKQEIEAKLFNQEILRQVKEVSSDTSVVAKVIDALVLAIEKEGIDSDLAAFIPQSVSKEEVIKSLSASVMEKIKEKNVELAGFTGGAKVKIVDDHLTLDMSDDALQRIVAGFINDELKAKLFA